MRKLVKELKVTKFLTIFAAVFLMTLVFGVKSEAATAPAQVTGLKQTGSDEHLIELEWEALLDDEARFEVALSTDKRSWTTVKSGLLHSDTVISKGLNAGKTYYAKVRAYYAEWNDIKEEYDYIDGPWSTPIDVVTTPDKDVTGLIHTKSTTTSISVKWDKTPGANCYVVKYKPDSTGYSGKYITKVVEGTSYTLTKLSKRERYHIYVYPARCTSNGNYCYYGWYTYDCIQYVPVLGEIKNVKCSSYSQKKAHVQMRCNALYSSSCGVQWELWTAYNKKDKRLKTVSKSSSTAYGDYERVDFKSSYLKKHNFFKVRVRSYVKNSMGKKCYGAWSNWKYISPRPDMKLKNTKSGIKASWDKIKGADRYVVYISTKKSSGYKKFCTTKGTSKTITKYGKSKLKSGKTYYMYVVAQNKAGKTYYSGNGRGTSWRIKYKK